MSKRRVVVTGLGAVTPIGNNVKDFWAGIREGKVGIGPITKFDTTDYKVKIAAEVKDFNAKDHMDPRAARRMDPFCQYAVTAAKEAFEDAGLDMEKEDSLARKSFSDFEDYVRRFEDLLYAEEKDWEQISSMMDVESFLSFYLLEEFSENPDSCRTSLYLYQDGPDDVLHMGPVWDFDKALGYAQKGKYGGDPERDYVSNIQEYMGTENDCTWHTELMKIPEFQDAVQEYYQTTARDVFLSSGQLIEDYRHRIAKSAEYTESIWSVAEIAENCGHDPVQFSTWDESVDYLDSWLQKRIQYFDQKWMSSN